MTSATSSTKFHYRSDVDGIRAIAVLAVVAYHYAPGRISGGFVGVDIFFVISGFLISSIIYNELEAGKFKIVEFYSRRIRRIYPALFFVLAAVSVAGWMVLLPTDYVYLGEQIVGGSTFVANIVLWYQSGYFSPDAELKPLLHLWSLGVEEQYYLIFPVICIVFFRPKSSRILSIAFLTIAMISMALNVAFVNRYSAAVFYMPFTRLWELFLGAGLALYQQHKTHSSHEYRLLPKWRTGAGILGLVLIAYSIVKINPSYMFPGWVALAPTLGSTLLIAAGPSSWVNRNILSCKPAVFLGLISYPLYLWHWPILAFARITHIWDSSSHVLMTLMIGPTILLAYLTYRFVELPIRHLKGVQRRQAVLLLLGGVLAVGAFGLLVILTDGFPSRYPSGVVALDHFYRTDASHGYREGTCFLRPDQSTFADTCLDPLDGHKAQKLLLVWGDSHAADLVPGFEALRRQSGWRLAQYTSNLCAPIEGLRLVERPYCQSINDEVLRRIKAIKPDIVVLSALWEYALHDDVGEKMLEHTIELVKAAGVPRVVVIGEAPLWKDNVPILLIEALYRTGAVPNRLALNLVNGHNDTLLQTATQKTRAVYVPLFEDLCDKSSCIVSTGPTWKDVMTYDNAHFTTHGSTLIAPLIWPDITQMKNTP